MTKELTERIDEVVTRVFRNTIEAAKRDGVITAEEEKLLERITADLENLKREAMKLIVWEKDMEKLEEVLVKHKKEILHNACELALEDGKISKDERGIIVGVIQALE